MGLAFNYLTVIEGQKIYPTIGCKDNIEVAKAPKEVAVMVLYK